MSQERYEHLKLHIRGAILKKVVECLPMDDLMRDLESCLPPDGARDIDRREDPEHYRVRTGPLREYFEITYRFQGRDLVMSLSKETVAFYLTKEGPL